MAEISQIKEIQAGNLSPEIQSRRKRMPKFLLSLFFLSLLSCSHFTQPRRRTIVRIATFNTLHLGWGKKNFQILASTLTNFDLIGLVEVMNKKGITRLKKQLEEESGETWSFLLSPRVGRSESYQESYAFCWKNSKVKIISTNGFYPSRSSFMRPPFAATFKIGRFDGTLVLFHIVYGRRVQDRRKEIRKLSAVYRYFQDSDKDEDDIILGGDFNLSANRPVFQNLYKEDEIFPALPPSVKTSIGKKGPASAYDNIFLSKYTGEYTGKSGIIDFTRNRFIWMRKNVSDHFPVYIEIYSDLDDDP